MGRIKLSSYWDIVAIITVLMATVFAPPFIRMLGSNTWITLGITEGQWSIIMAGRGLVFIIFILAAGVIGDLWGRRRMLLLALVGFILCVPILIIKRPFSPEFFITYTFWAIFGLMIKTLVLTLLILKFDGRQRIVALIIYSIFTGAGFLFAPLLASALKQHVGFNAVFIVPLILAALGLVLGWKYLKDSSSSYDLWGLDAVALAVWTFGLCLMIFAGVVSGGLGWTNPLVLAGVGIGGLLILAMSWLSGRPLSDKWKFKLRYDHKLGFAIYTGVVLSLAFYAITVQVFNFMSRVQDYSPILSGVALAPILIGAFISIRVVRRIGRWKIGDAIAAGLAIIAIPALILVLLKPDISYWVLLPCLLLLGFGFILTNSPRLLLLDASVPRSLAATVQSIGDATAHLGSALAYSFMMTLLEGFGTRAYIQTLESFGLSELQIAFRLSTITRASEEFSIIAPGDEQAEILQQIDFWIVQAYTTGLAQAMLVLAGVCLFSAAIVYFGLRDTRMTEKLDSQE